MPTLYLDFETYSATPINNGTYKYAENAEVLLMAYALDEREVQVADFTDPIQRATFTDMLRDTVARDDVEVVIHNSMFDRNIAKYALGVEIPPEKIHDTMIIAAMHGLPMGLGTLCEVFRLPVDASKSKEGRKLINMFCKPRPKNMKERRALPENYPEDWQAFKEYARLDVVSMRELWKLLPIGS